MSPSRSFSASYDSLTKTLSAILCGAVLIAGIATGKLLVLLLGAVFMLLAWAWSPRSYGVSRGEILVRRAIGAARMPLAGLREARAAGRDDLRGVVRLFGNGGLFGYYGLFRTSKLGKCSWYCTNRSKMVVVVTDAKTALFSPDDVPGFLAALGAVPASAGASPIEPARASLMPAIIGAAIGALALGVVLLAFLYSPGPPDCTLTATSLTIHDRFYPVTLRADAVDVGGIRIVDVARDTQWRTTARTNGFANGHYRSGWFRVANGNEVRLYQAGGHRLVLIPQKTGPAVLVDARDPEKLLDEIRSAWQAAR